MESYSQILIKNLQKHDPYKTMSEYQIRKTIGHHYGIHRARNIELEIELEQFEPVISKQETKIKSPKTQRMIEINGPTYNKLVKEGYFNPKSEHKTELYSLLPNELKDLISDDLDCKSIISLLQTAKGQNDLILRKKLKAVYGFNTNHLTSRQLVNLCYSQHVKIVGNYTMAMLNRRGEVYVLGYNINKYGMGVNSKKMLEKAPVKINFNQKVIDVSTGFMKILLLTDKHQIYYTGEEITPDIKDTKSFEHLKEIKYADVVDDYNRFIIYLDHGDLYGLGFFESVFDYDEPTKLSNQKFTKFYISNDTVFSIDVLGQVYILGRNKTMLDLNKKRDYNLDTLTLVPGLNNIIEIAIGNEHILFLNNQGEVFGSGENNHKQLGFSTNETYNLIKLKLQKIVHIGVAYDTSYIIDEDMNLYGFGYNYNHLLALDSDEISVAEPTLILKDVIKIAGGSVNKLLILDINGDTHLLGQFDHEDAYLRKINNLFL